MKKLIIFITAAALTGSAFAAQDTISRQTVHRRILPTGNDTARTEGGFQRGVRAGNPAQLVNPAAPAQYGSGQDFVNPKEEQPGVRSRGKVEPYTVGLRLFSIPF